MADAVNVVKSNYLLLEKTLVHAGVMIRVVRVVLYWSERVRASSLSFRHGDIDELLSRELNVSNPSLHEYVLAKVKAESLSYAKASTKEYHDNTEQLKVELNDLINSDDPNNTKKNH